MEMHGSSFAVRFVPADALWVLAMALNVHLTIFWYVPRPVTARSRSLRRYKSLHPTEAEKFGAVVLRNHLRDIRDACDCLFGSGHATLQ